MEDRRVTEADLARQIVGALGGAALIVDASGNLLASMGCVPGFTCLTDSPAFTVLVQPIARAARSRLESTLEASFPSPPDFKRVRPQRVRIVPFGVEQVLVWFEALARVASPAVDQLREYEFVVRNIRQGIWRLDREHRIVFANPYLAGWLETTPERLAGRDIRDFLPDGTLDHEREAGVDRFESEFVTETGLRRRCIVVSSPTIDATGRVTGRVELITDITAEHAVQSRLVQEVHRMAQLASLDPLTNLLNRRAFELILADLGEDADRHPFGLVLLDLDGLKGINDSLGHEAGDVAIREFAKGLSLAVRDSDRVARLGGDEFAVLVPNVSRDELAEVAGRLASRMHIQCEFKGTAIEVGASLGWAHSSQGAAELQRLADVSLYETKRAR